MHPNSALILKANVQMQAPMRMEQNNVQINLNEFVLAFARELAPKTFLYELTHLLVLSFSAPVPRLGNRWESLPLDAFALER